MAMVVALTNAGLFPFFAVVLPLWVAQGLRASATTMAIIEVAFGLGIFAGSALLTTRLNAALGRFTALVTMCRPPTYIAKCCLTAPASARRRWTLLRRGGMP